MKRAIILLITLVSFIGLLKSQNKTYQNSDKLQVNRYFINDTIYNLVDTIYIMNTKTFYLYNTVYNSTRTNKQCNQLYSPIIKTLEGRISQQSKEYKELNLKFNDLLLSTKIQEQNNNIIITDLKNNISQLDTTAILLEINYKELIKQHKKELRNNRIIFIVSGIASGVIIGVLLK